MTKLTLSEWLLDYAVEAKDEHDFEKMSRLQESACIIGAMAGISDPAAWVRSAREVARLAIAQDFPVELANALCDMKAAEGEE